MFSHRHARSIAQRRTVKSNGTEQGFSTVTRVTRSCSTRLSAHIHTFPRPWPPAKGVTARGCRHDTSRGVPAEGHRSEPMRLFLSSSFALVAGPREPHVAQRSVDGRTIPTTSHSQNRFRKSSRFTQSTNMKLSAGLLLWMAILSPAAGVRSGSSARGIRQLLALDSPDRRQRCHLSLPHHDSIVCYRPARGTSRPARRRRWRTWLPASS